MKVERFDGMAWPSLAGLDDTVRELRYGVESPSRLEIASVMAAYGALVRATQRQRNAVCKELVKRWGPKEPTP